MQPRNTEPHQFMLWVALVLAIIACFMLASGASGATCEEQCRTSCAISTQEVCDQCIEACERITPTRIQPVGPTRQPGVDYTLHRTIGFTGLDYMDPDFEGWPEYIAQVREYGFTTTQIWARYSSLYCMGAWIPPYPSNMWVTHDRNCDVAMMLRHGGSTQIFIKLEPYMSQQLVRFLMNRWYELAWWEDLTIVFSRWEQDNYLVDERFHKVTEIDYDTYMERWRELKQEEEEIQSWVEHQRGVLMKRYPHANLQILNSMTVNRFPNYNTKPWAEGWPTVTDMIAEMEHKPDLIGASLWKRGVDPTIALDYIQATTQYPRARVFIAEFGAKASEQPARYYDYVRTFWDWGVRTVIVWAWRTPWDGDLYTPTAEGLAALQELNEEAIGW